MKTLIPECGALLLPFWIAKPQYTGACGSVRLVGFGRFTASSSGVELESSEQVAHAV